MRQLGFSNISDLLTTLVIPTKSVWITGALTAISGFITHYMYTTAEAVYFLFFLLAIDFITGILKAIFVQKDFCSRKFPRSIVSAVSYALLLIISTGAAKHSVWFTFLPNFVYGILLSTLIISIVENMTKLGWIDASLMGAIKNKIKEVLKLKKGE